MNRHTLFTFLVASFFIVPGILLTRYHHTEGQLSFSQQRKITDTVELSVTFEAPALDDGAIKRRELRFWLPEIDRNWQVVDEQIKTGKFSLVILEEEGRRIGILSTRSSRKEPLVAEYRMTLSRRSEPKKLTANEPLIEVADDDKRKFLKLLIAECGKPKDLHRERATECLPNFVRSLRSQHSNWVAELLDAERLTTRGLATLLAELLSESGVKAVSGYSFPLKGFQSSIEPRYVLFLEINGGDHLAYDFRSERIESGKGYLTWGEDRPILASSRELDGLKVLVASAAAHNKDTGLEKAPDSKLLQYLSIQRLPPATQALFEFTLLLPLASLVICIVRNFIGLVTFGTFMPALLGLSFLQTGIVAGSLLSLVILGAGCLARLAADHLHMLLVPRLAAVLTTVTILFYLLTQLSFDFGWAPGLQISLFPVIVLTMMVERLTLIIDEHGFMTALSRLFVTLLSASLCYFVLVRPETQYLFFTFPELNLVVLGIAIIFGRYTGYRLTELVRFREIARGEK